MNRELQTIIVEVEKALDHEVHEMEHDIQADVDAVMKKYDRESNTRIWEGAPKIALRVLMSAFSIYCILMTLFSKALPERRLSLFLGFIIIIGYLVYPARKGATRVNHVPWYDWILMVLGAGSFFYFAINAFSIIQLATKLQPIHIIVGAIGIVVLIELCRRCVGLPILVVLGLLLIYTFYNQLSWDPSFYKALKNIVYKLFYTTSGVIGTPVSVCYTYIVLFIIFGAFLERTGIANFFISFANRLAGWSSGGPAKVAVISSALCGMVSGSSVGNTVTTGSVTIPMMKKTGYPPEFAGAVEAASSTGGQIMPPIMGVGAFIMAEMLGVPYSRVAAAAILPAVAYYFAVFVLVDRLAAKHQNAAQEQDAKIKVERTILPRLYLLLPAVILVVMIIRGASLMRAGMMGIVSCLICDVVSYFINEKKDFVDLKGIWNCCLDGAKQAAEIAIPTAACGIIINVVTGQTSLATNLSALISSLGTTNLFAAMLIAMIGCMLLGMALPTVAAYLVGVILFVPCLRALGISALCANMFVFYYGIMAQITPPVCVASYTAAGIADANAMKTGIKGFTFAMVGFLVPFVFVYNPAILLEGNVVEIVIGAAQMLLGTFFLAVTVAGYFKRNFKPFERVALFIAALLLIAPEVISSIIGVVLGVGVLMLDTIASKKNGAKAA